MPRPNPLVYDTSVYITAIREGVLGPNFRTLIDTLPRTYLVSVVSAELRAGAVTESARRAVHQFTGWAQRVGRVVTPSAATWDRTGDVLSEIRIKEQQLRSRIPALWNDLLIALSARQVGAGVVTDNVRDFELLRRYVRFDLTSLS